jgi:predicted DCC family thiol-disulfide oxidoreductase YuxK
MRASHEERARAPVGGAGNVLPPPGAAVILVDGTCVFSNRLARFILAHDRRGELYFAHLQGPFAQAAKRRHGFDGDDIDGVYVLIDSGTPAERLLRDGAASRAIWPRLFRIAVLLRLVPLPLLDWSYRLFARYRYRLFGRYDTCRVPTSEQRGRFIDA